MERRYLSSISATAVHGRFDIEQQFVAGVNVFHGRNGTGKTTLLHILANALNEDYSRFFSLKFERIVVLLSDGATIELTRVDSKEDEAIRVKPPDGVASVITQPDPAKERPIERYRVTSAAQPIKQRPDSTQKRAAYFPAFRATLEALDTSEHRSQRASSVLEETWHWVSAHQPDSDDDPATALARKLFGEFVPSIQYPSIREIEHQLAGELRTAQFRVGLTDKELFSNAFLEVFDAIGAADSSAVRSPDNILDEIHNQFKRLEESALPNEVKLLDVFAELRKRVTGFRPRPESSTYISEILEVYKRALLRRADSQQTAFRPILDYLESVNAFLEGKKLSIGVDSTKPRGLGTRVNFEDGTTGRLRHLSSGERQIVTLLFAASHMSAQDVVLIDEPEISLHVDWQRLLLHRMEEQLGGRQIIACTHSPVVGADWGSNMIELSVAPTKHPRSLFDSSDATEEPQSPDE